MATRAVTLRGLVVAFVLVTTLIVVSLAIVAGIRFHRQSLRTQCAGNLRQLHEVGWTYAQSHNRLWPTETGSRFWIFFTTTTPPLIDPQGPWILECPVRGEVLKTGETDFRGPRSPYETLRAEDGLGADKAGNHGNHEGGHVLRKAGDIQLCELHDRAWKDCIP